MKNERTSHGVTTILYEQNSYLTSFTAKVLECREVLGEDKQGSLWALILDRTAFFPEGGGQDADKGTLGGQEVKDVKIKDGRICHLVEKPVATGNVIEGIIDWEVRNAKMQNHTGEHLFCGIMYQKYGYENVGFHMSENLVTIDLNGFLSDEQLIELEKEANEAIRKNVSVYCVYPETPDELEYRSKLELEEEIRVVIIEGYDACACCAPHVKTTGEIGIIKVIDSMPHRGGVRITLKCGKSAYEDYALLHEETAQIMRFFSSKREECHLAAKRVSLQLKTQQETITALKKQITGLHIERLRESARLNPDKRAQLIFDETLDEIQMRELLNEGVTLFRGIVGGFMGNDKEGYRFIIAAYEKPEENMVSLPELALQIRTELAGRGGGSPKMIQGSVAVSKAEIEAFWKKEVLKDEEQI